MISAIAAIGKNREIGKNNELLWKIPEDTKYFRDTTSGHPVIMGRKTWESMHSRALPNRTNIVVTRNPDFKAEGAIAVTSVESAIAQAKGHPGDDEIFIIGGAEIYKLALPLTDRLYITMVNGTFDADAFFPEYPEFIKVIQKSEVMTSGSHKYYYITLER